MKSDKKIWFVPKRYGWGFFPVSVAGRIATLILLGLVLISAWINGLFLEFGPTGQQIGRFLLDLFLLIFSTSWFGEKYMDGPLQWRRGKD